MERIVARDIDSMTPDEVRALLAEQSAFTEALRHAAAEAMAHLGHITANYAHDVPDDVLRAAMHARVPFDIMSMTPSPVMRGLAN